MRSKLFTTRRRTFSSSSSKYPSTVIFSWGLGTHGQLGHAKFELTTEVLGQKYQQDEPRKLLKSKRFQSLAVGENYSLGLTYEGDLYGWGLGLVQFNESQSSKENREPVPLIVGGKISSIAAGSKHAAFVNSVGQAFTWGHGGSWFSGGGQLGHGSTSSEIRPRFVEFFKEYGAKISSVSCGGQHTLFLTDDGEILCCGVGEYGLIGNGDTSDARTPVSLDSFEDAVIKQAVAGQDHSLALTSDGKIYSWGRNNHGQLGHSDSYMDIYSLENIPRKIEVEAANSRGEENVELKFAHIAAANGRSAAVTEDGLLFVWGHRLAHRPKLIERKDFDNLSVLKVVCGGDSARSVIAVITEDFGLWTLGDYSSGMLGKKGSGKRVSPERVEYLKGKKVLDVFAGLGQHIFAKVETTESF